MSDSVEHGFPRGMLGSSEKWKCIMASIGDCPTAMMTIRSDRPIGLELFWWLGVLVIHLASTQDWLRPFLEVGSIPAAAKCRLCAA